MVEKIKLKICVPDNIYKQADVDRVQIPAYEGDFTILPQTAPTVFVLKKGFIRIVDDKEKGRYFINSGFADYFEGICKIMVEDVIDYKDMSIESYQLKLDEAQTDEDRAVFQEIVDLLVLEKIKEA